MDVWWYDWSGVPYHKHWLRGVLKITIEFPGKHSWCFLVKLLNENWLHLQCFLGTFLEQLFCRPVKKNYFFFNEYIFVYIDWFSRAQALIWRQHWDQTSQPAIICSKLTIKVSEQQYVVLMSLLLTLNIFHTFFWCFY